MQYPQMLLHKYAEPVCTFTTDNRMWRKGFYFACDNKKNTGGMIHASPAFYAVRRGVTGPAPDRMV